MTNHEDARNQSGFPLGGTPGYIAPVSAKVRVNTDQADLFRRKTSRPRNRSTDCLLIPTSGTLAQ